MDLINLPCLVQEKHLISHKYSDAILNRWHVFTSSTFWKTLLHQNKTRSRTEVGLTSHLIAPVLSVIKQGHLTLEAYLWFSLVTCSLQVCQLVFELCRLFHVEWFNWNSWLKMFQGLAASNIFEDLALLSLLVLLAANTLNIYAGIIHHPCPLPCPSSLDNESRTTRSSGIN